MSRSVTNLESFELAASETGSDLQAALALAADEWCPAVVPGGVLESLLAADRVPNPYLNENEGLVAWIEDRDWWYRTTFTAPKDLEDGERLRLRFLGLDTVAELWLNGDRLGSHQNMYRPAEFDITDRAQTENELVVRFSPPLQGLELPPKTESWERLSKFLPADGDLIQLAAQRRKPMFSWGWDFNPRIPAVGIWRPVGLVREKEAVISGHHIKTDRIDADGTAHLKLLVEVERTSSTGNLSVDIDLTDPDGETHHVEIEIPAGNDRAAGQADLSLANAALWWTHDLGTPMLHDLSLRLTDEGSLLDEAEDRIGIRTIELDRSEDPEGGRLFRFVLNGVPVFARGAAWIPADMMLGSVSAERYQSLLDLAVEGEMNMLRVWGGGIYEHDAFYDACDERGVLIWHDFMFANAEYPSESAELQTEVAAEAEYQVRRLRNRPSLALWCGNNEIQLFHGMGYHSLEPGNWGWDIFHRILPEIVEREGGTTAYWPGSPWGEAPEEGYMAPGGLLDGDRHAWEVWHGLDFGAGGGNYESVGESRHYRRYERDKGKFISEFGIHASPEEATLRRWIDDDKLSVHSPTFDAHNKDHPKDKSDPVLEIITGIPGSLEEYIDFTMVYQAEGLKFGIEHYRRRQPHNNGTLVWQFNDCWPGFSWSIVDYDGVPKAGYYFSKRAFSPVIASFTHENGNLELWLSNSTAIDKTLAADVSVQRFDGTKTLDESVSAEVPAGQSVLAWSTELEADPELVAWVRNPEGDFPDNRLYFGEIRELPLTPAELDVQIEPKGSGGATVNISTDSLAYLVRIPTPAPGVRFSDNYVDVAAGQPVSIEVTGLPEDFDATELEVRSYAGVVSEEGTNAE